MREKLDNDAINIYEKKLDVKQLYDIDVFYDKNLKIFEIILYYDEKYT